MSIQNPTLNFQVGNLKNVPVVIDKEDVTNGLVQDCIDFSRNDWDLFKTSWDFKKHPLI